MVFLEAAKAYAVDILNDMRGNVNHAELGLTIAYLLGVTIYTAYDPGIYDLLWLAVPLYTTLDTSLRAEKGEGLSEKIGRLL